MGYQRTGPLAALAATIALLATACAPGASPPASSPPSALSAPPAGSGQALPSSPSAGDQVAGCPNYVDVVETGPLPSDMGEDGPIPQEQARLGTDIEAAIAYGAAHPDEFASVRFENAPRVRIVIGFTDHLDVHCAALRAMFQYPDEFEIIRQPRTAGDIEQIQSEIVALAGDKLRSAGIGAGTIDIALRADAESVAKEIQTRYGDLVRIQLGLQPYPPGPAPVGECAVGPGQIAAGSPFAATLRLEPASVRSGEDFAATATVTNRSDSPVDFESGEPVTAFVYRTGTDQVVAAYDGGIGGVGLGRSLGPGESMDVKVVGGTASCLSELGYTLPPGQYDVRAAIEQYEHPAAGDTIVTYLLSAPAVLTVTP